MAQQENQTILAKINGVEVKGTDENLQELKQSCSNAVIGIGQIKTPSIREKIANKLVQIGYNTPAIISKYAVVSEYANVKEGVTVGHGSIVNANAYIGKFCIINTGAILEHSTRVGDFCHISTGVIVNGDVDIEEELAGWQYYQGRFENTGWHDYFSR